LLVQAAPLFDALGGSLRKASAQNGTVADLDERPAQIA